jgi:Concanavalin A-like lectin/glucanases superfamily
MTRRLRVAAVLAPLLLAPLLVPVPASAGLPEVYPGLWRSLAVHYDFEHPVRGDAAKERDQGFSGTDLDLVNGGAGMRVRDGAHPGSRYSMQTRQIDPATAGNDDWKAGVYSATGVPTLTAFNAVRTTTVLGWFKRTGDDLPALNSNTADPADHFDAVGLAGLLSGDSNGHSVRSLLELITVDGTLRLVALGRRLDGGSSLTYAANADWRELLPRDVWVFLAATFDFDRGTMALYRNGKPVEGFYTDDGDPWQVGGPGPHVSSPTDPRGIKIGGSFPQNTREQNPCDCRFDDLMFLDRALTPTEVARQYHWASAR